MKASSITNGLAKEQAGASRRERTGRLLGFDERHGQRRECLTVLLDAVTARATPEGNQWGRPRG
jgi:hypothetical protein